MIMNEDIFCLICGADEEDHYDSAHTPAWSDGNSEEAQIMRELANGSIPTL